MKETINHLPENKQQELNLLVHHLRKHEDVHMIILFGSFATGKWVEDCYVEKGITYSYHSDYDILVVLPREDFKAKLRIEEDLKRKHIYPGRVKTPVNLIFHGIDHLNDHLSQGNYFFVDLIREGILLFDSKKFILADPKELTPEEKQKKAQGYFDQWFNTANSFFKHYTHAFNDNELCIAAFQLHQSTERYFTTILLVFTDYRPKEHNLYTLYDQVISADKRFSQTFPNATKEEKDRFDLLKRAYIDARYRMDEYHITREDLEYLSERVKVLREMTEVVCGERIGELGGS